MRIDEYYISYKTIDAVLRQGAYVSIELNKYIDQIPQSRRAFTTRLVYGVFDREIELNYIAKKYAKKIDKSILAIIYMGVYMIKYMKIEDHASINCCVELSKNAGKGMYSGFINALLRNIAVAIKQDEIEYPKDKDEYLSTKYSYPMWAVKMLTKQYGEESSSIIKYEADHKYVEIRVNLNEISIKEFEEILVKKNVEYKKGLVSGTYFVSYANMKGISKDLYFMQSHSSAIVVEALGVKGKCRVLDCCASPGGKSVLIAQKNKDAKVVACDIHPHRINLINSYANKGKCKNIETSMADATTFKKDFVDAFDYVLVDAPCSGFGVINQKPDIKRNKDEDAISELAVEQKKILNNVGNYVKCGGTILYSTCSIFESENIEVVKDFLRNNSGFKIQKIEFSFDISSKAYIDESGSAIQLLPYRDGLDGFFMCKMIRVK